MRKACMFVAQFLDKTFIARKWKCLKDNECSVGLFSKRHMFNEYEINKYIYDSILSGEPFLVGRFGGFELNMMVALEFGRKKRYEQCLHDLCANAGFFPKQMGVAKGFLGVMLDFCKQCDVLAMWQPYEGYFIKNYMAPDVHLTQLQCIEPWKSPKLPWSAALKGKKVLVIHPFADTIEKQYKKREQLFPNTDILPEFQIRTLKAVQTAAGESDDRFETWFDALEWMHEETKKIDFDVAILGCGAYGAPLAAKIKKDGKQAIHLGGVTQILFGIMGKRWDGSMNNWCNYIKVLENDSWTRPNEKERPSGADKIEGGCYW